MSPKIAEIQKEARREQIIQAACKCFAEKGFHATTMKDICRQSRLSAGAVYHYFQGKDELIRAIGELGRKNTAAFFDSISRPEKTTGQMAELFKEAVSFLISKDGLQNARLSIRMWGEALHTKKIRELLSLNLSGAIDSVAVTVRRAQKSGEIDPQLDASSIARIWLALYMGLSVQLIVDSTTAVTDSQLVAASLFNGTFTTARNDEVE